MTPQTKAKSHNRSNDMQLEAIRPHHVRNFVSTKLPSSMMDDKHRHLSRAPSSLMDDKHIHLSRAPPSMMDDKRGHLSRALCPVLVSFMVHEQCSIHSCQLYILHNIT